MSGEPFPSYRKRRVKMSNLGEEYRLETFVDPPQESDGIRALVCDTAAMAKEINESGELPADKIAYGVLSGVGGMRFKDIEFHFDFSLPRYQSETLVKQFLEVVDDWSLHISGDKVDLVNERIECIKAGLTT